MPLPLVVLDSNQRLGTRGRSLRIITVSYPLDEQPTPVPRSIAANLQNHHCWPAAEQLPRASAIPRSIQPRHCRMRAAGDVRMRRTRPYPILRVDRVDVSGRKAFQLIPDQSS